MPILRAEEFYAPAHPLPPDAWASRPPAERVFAWVEVRLSRRVVPPEGMLLGTRGYARINHGRWIADCASCGSAQVVSPDDPRFACTECGHGWVPLTFPDDVAAVEDALADALPVDQNWWHPDDPTAPPPPAEPAPEEA
ncbi:hypothetical protein AB0N23_16160 [Streptomyces sp. NPDC052644]